MTDVQKQALTEWLEGCDHPDDFVREYMGGVFCHKCNHIIKPRTFTAAQDVFDLKDKLVEKGLWEEFEDFALVKKNTPVISMFSLCEWLFRCTDESGKPHFTRLVCEFLESIKWK